jgi:hypothetical protein
MVFRNAAFMLTIPGRDLHAPYLSTSSARNSVAGSSEFKRIRNAEDKGMMAKIPFK